MIAKLKVFGRQRFPKLYRWTRRTFDSYHRLTYQVGQQVDWRVATGPFSGMRYIDDSWGSRLIPKLVGSYEQELHPWVEQLASEPFNLVVDVGSGEGYYAVGMALLMPDVHVIAYDLVPRARELCARVAELNGVADRISIRAGCTTEELASLDLAHALLISDCEGYESEILNPQKLPALAQCTILVELHDCYVPGLTPTLQARFAGSHTFELLDSVERDPSQYPVLRHFDGTSQKLALDEFRIQNGQRVLQQWALLRPLTSTRHPAISSDALTNA